MAVINWGISSHRPVEKLGEDKLVGQMKLAITHKPLKWANTSNGVLIENFGILNFSLVFIDGCRKPLREGISIFLTYVFVRFSCLIL